MLANTESKKKDKSKNKANALFFLKKLIMEKEEKKKEKKQKEERSALHDFIIYTLIIVFVILLRSFVVTPVQVSGSSMDTTLKDGQIMLLDKISYRFEEIKRFDIVVIKENDSYIIKRVIGLPGEKLLYKDDVLYINDKETKENFKNQKTEDFNIKDLGYEKIPNDCYFVLGDNRKVSLDSRIIGCIKKEDILGKANIVIFPFNNIGYKD